jgi:hypothetical protein
VLEELLVFAEIGQDEEVAGQEEEGSFGLGVLVPEEMLVDEVGDLQLIIDVVGHTVVGHVADELGLELHVFEGILEIVQIHMRYLIP